MRRLSIVAAATTLAAFALVQIAVAQTWERTIGPNGSFSFEMPGKPSYDPVVMSNNNKPYTLHQYQVQTSAAAFVVQTAIYSYNVTGSQPKKVLQGIFDQVVKNDDEIKHTDLRWTT